MLKYKPFHINAKTISDAWFQCIYNVFDQGYVQAIQKGSFEKEQHRIQYPSLSIFIELPHMDMVPQIPSHLNIPSPTTEEFIMDYFSGYIMNPELGENETYKYASRINEIVDLREEQVATQLDLVMQMLSKTPLTNQAVIEIAKPSDIHDCIGKDGKLDPPCLRLIDFKAIPVTGIKIDEGDPSIMLTMSVYFRSWDLWAGLPTNLGGLELLKQFVASHTGLINGPMYAYSAGAHIYGYQEEIAKIRTMRK